MPGRRDWPENPTNFAPWTLDLTSNSATGVRPSTDAAEGEYPAGCFDVRRSRGYSLQINFSTVATSAAVVELQWSIDGVNFISLGAAYQLTVPTGTPPASSGWIVQNPFYPFVRVACITAGGAGTASTGHKIFFAARD